MTLKTQCRKPLVAAVLFLIIAGAAGAQDWPQWRGSNRDGVVAGFVAPKTWPDQLKQRWKINVGEGHSSPVVAGGRVFLHSRQGEQEVAASYDLASGKQLWKDAYAVTYKMHPAATGHGKGPKSTPIVSNGRLYTLGITGILTCYDAATGKVAWRKDFASQYKQTSPVFGTAMSPLVDRGLLIAHVGGHDQGGLAAFDATTGAVKWSWTGDGPGYASPVIVELGGVRQVVTQSQQNVIGTSAASGELLWKIPYATEYEQNIVTPVVTRDLVIISGLNKGVTALRPVKRGNVWAADEAWQNKDASLYMNSPLLRGNLLFGFSHRNKGQYFCIDVKSGKTLWSGDGRQGENAALLLVGDLIFALNNDAELSIFPATATLQPPIKKYKVADSPTWAHPVLLPGRVLVKDANTLALWSFE
jgi:outer membrane protein assembly factor BamB